MRNKNLVAFTLLFSILLLACSNDMKSEKPVLSGKVLNLKTSELYLIDLMQQKAGPVDTAIVGADGSFSFDFQPPMKGFYRITLSENFAFILPLVKGETATIKGDINQPQDIEVGGTEDAIRMKELNDMLSDNYQKSQALEQGFQQYVNSPKRDSILVEFRAKYAELEKQKIERFKKMIDENPESFTNLAILEQMPTEEADYYMKVDKALSNRYNESPYYKNFHSKVVDISKFAVGSEVPEIRLPNPEGEFISLSSLRGKVVLIDFWASWCRPCRQENPNVVAAYQKYKDKGFTVYGVSLDKTKQAWVNAIQQDGLTWTHVSDLQFWQSEAAKAYGVSSIPFALLIDEDGKVIGKNLRGAALHQKLAEVLD